MNRLPPPLRPVDRTYVEHRGRRLSYFGGCDYYRLATHPIVVEAARDALETCGFGVSASRVTTGNHPLFEELEAWLARFFGSPGAVLLGAGYAANPAVAQALAGEVTHAILDETAHASLRDAVAFLGCASRTFAHGDASHLKRQLARLPARARPLVLTDGLFGRDGFVAPLAEYLEVLPPRGRILLDDAHGAGVLGRRGRGTLEYCGVTDARVIRTATLSKAFGAYGGVILTDARLAARVRERSRWFSASTPMPLPAAAAARAAGWLIQRDAAMRERLQVNVARLYSGAAAAGLRPQDEAAPILAVVPRSAAEANRLRRELLSRDIYPSLIHYSDGPSSGYFRFAVSSEHDADQVAALVGAITPKEPVGSSSTI